MRRIPRSAVVLPYFLVFLSSACVMVLELVASRMIAQHVGSNLYTWTSIIAVVLSGITVGNLVGGWSADRLGSTKIGGVLAGLLVASGLFSLLVVVLVGPVFLNDALRGMTLPVRVLLSVTLVYFLPSVVLGAVTPLAAAWALGRNQRLGATVGALYAFGSLGAIFGTLVTGFFLMTTFGSLTIMAGITALLSLTAVAVDRRLPVVLPAAFVVAAAVAFAWLGGGTYVSPAALSSGDVLYLRDTRYQTVAITSDPSHDIRTVVLDNLVHGYIDPSDPTVLVYPYIAAYAVLYEVHRDASQAASSASLHLGGGAYTLPRFLAHAYPADTVVVAEIDPGVTAANQAAAGLADPPPFELHHEDARAVVRRLLAEGRRMDVVFADAFRDYAIPAHLASVEFFREVDALLRPGGVALVNVIDDLREPRMLSALVATIGEVHDHVAVFAMAAPTATGGRNTFVVASSRTPLNSDAVLARARQATLDTELVPLAMLGGSSRDPNPWLVLTDDFAPVERLVAHLYAP